MVFVDNDAYCRYVNICMKDFTRYINLNSFVQMPYIKGNNDDCDIFSIGGIALYDKMVDPNTEEVTETEEIIDEKGGFR